MLSLSTSSESKPKLLPVILEAMVRNLSDHDLLRFMLSSKEAFNATLDALSTVDYVNIHDENFENEPCIAFGMRGDFEPKSEFNYITQSNPIFNFVVNYLKGRLIGLKTCNLVEIEPWILNALMTSRLQKLSLGIVLPKSCKKILKHAPNLTKITFSTFDIFVANNFIPFRCEDIVVDFLKLSEIKKIVKLPFTPSTVVESISLGESNLFKADYDSYADDFIRRYWKRLINFLISSFPSLKVLDIRLGGYTDSPVKILNWWNMLKHFIYLSMPSNIQLNVTFDVLIPANKWLAIDSVFSNLAVQSDGKVQAVSDQTAINNRMRNYIKNRRFPDYFDDFPLKYNCETSQGSSFIIQYYGKWEEYDFDAVNDEEYGLSIIHTEFVSSEEDFSDFENLHTLSTQSLTGTSEMELVTARDKFWSRESQSLSSNDTVNCNESIITDSTQTTMTEDFVENDAEIFGEDFEEITNNDEESVIIFASSPPAGYYADDNIYTVSTQSLTGTSEMELVTARDEFWNHENQVSDFDDTLKCVKSLITDSSRSLVTQNSVKSDTETDTTSSSEDSTSDDEDSDTSSVSDTNSDSSNETTLTDDCDESNTETITTVTSECSTCVSDASTQDSFTD